MPLQSSHPHWTFIHKSTEKLVSLSKNAFLMMFIIQYIYTWLLSLPFSSNFNYFHYWPYILSTPRLSVFFLISWPIRGIKIPGQKVIGKLLFKLNLCEQTTRKLPKYLLILWVLTFAVLYLQKSRKRLLHILLLGFRHLFRFLL